VVAFSFRSIDSREQEKHASAILKAEDELVNEIKENENNKNKNKIC
jgi:hypothetical protein